MILLLNFDPLYFKKWRLNLFHINEVKVPNIEKQKFFLFEGAMMMLL